MFFVSTRNSKVIAKFKDAALNVVAEHQGGIFTPSFFTPMNFNQIYDLSTKSYKEILIELLYQFSDNYIDKNTLTSLINDAFKDFNRGFGYKGKNLHCTGDEIFTMQTLEENLEIANLTYGPTGCCKDYGYCVASSIVNFLAKKEGKHRSIIDISGGTSGPSIAWAVRGKDFLKGFTLLRIGKNPSVKALMSQASKDVDNIGFANVSADHNFINQIRYDVANNTSLKELANMTFINEMNLLCIFAYMPIFFKAYARCNNKPFCVSVPTGNMSLGMAAFFAKKLGIPIRKIILAVEKNDFFTNVQVNKVAINNSNIESGCSSFHTNIPTNFERLMFYLYDNNQQSVKRAIQELESNGRYKINDSLLSKFQEHFYVAQCDNQFTIRNTIYSAIREKDLYVEQHYALSKMAIDVAMAEIQNEINNTPIVIFNTLDYRRNVSFVNASLGYDMERVEYPWTNDDVNSFSATEIKKDISEILRYIVSFFDDPETFKKMNEENQKKEEE